MPSLAWTPGSPVHFAATPDGHYRIVEVPAGLDDTTLRFLAVRSMIDRRGRLWEYQVGRFRSLESAQKECHLDSLDSFAPATT